MATPSVLSVERDGDVLIVTLHGNINSFSEARVLAELDDLLTRWNELAVRGVVIDFEQLAFFGSLILEALRILWTQLRTGKTSWPCATCRTTGVRYCN